MNPRNNNDQAQQTALQKAAALYTLKEYNEALLITNQLLNNDPNNISALYRRGAIYVQLKQEDKAIADFDKIVALEPNNYSAHHLYGLGLYNLKKYEAALSAFEHSLQLNREQDAALRYKAWCHASLNQPHVAKKLFEEVIEKNPSSDAYLSYGNALYVLKEYQEAIVQLDNCLKLNPSSHQAHCYKAYAFSCLNKPEEAEKEFANCVAASPDNLAAWQLYEEGINFLAAQQAPVTAQPIHTAVFKKNHAALEFLLKKGANANSIHATAKHSALHTAVQVGDQTAITILLDNGAEIDSKDEASLTPLHYAVYYCKPACVKLLLEKGANINARTDACEQKHHHAFTPLEMAQSIKNDAGFRNDAHMQEIIDILTAFKLTQDANTEVNERKAPLNTMSYQQQEQENMQRNDQLLAMLEKLAKDVENLKEENIAQKHQITDLVNKNKELTQEISELKNKPEKTGKELFNQELLDIAANGAPDAQFETLFILGANINITNKSGDTVVHVALRNTQQRTAAFLLSKAPHLLTTANQEGYDPLQLVAHLGQAELFGWLYDTAKGMEYFKNNDTFEKLYDVATAEIKAILASKKLIEATKAEKMTDVELALNKGADVHYRTSDGDTALHKAVEYKNVKIIELLLAHGASTMPYDALHRNVLEVAKLTRSKTVTEKIAMAFLFESAKKDSRPYIVRVVTNEVEQELWASRGGVFAKDREVLLKQDGDRLTYYVAGNQSGTIAFSELGISSYEESGDLRDKILAITAAHEHTPLDVKIALNAGADINAIDEKDGLPALIKAVIAGKQENVKALIAAGADININAKDGQTALHKAIIAGNDDMMRILIDAGANVNAVDPADGLSPLLKAVIAGKQDIVASLIEKGANLIATDPKNGEIALHKAVANAQYAIMELLLMGHAKAKNTIHVADKEGKTPCDRAGDTRITTKKKHNLLLAAYMTQHFGKYKAQCQDKDGAKILSSSSNSFLSAIGSAANAPQTTANTQQEAEKATTSAGMSLNSSH